MPVADARRVIAAAPLCPPLGGIVSTPLELLVGLEAPIPVPAAAGANFKTTTADERRMWR
jgi:hypothetical protein